MKYGINWIEIHLGTWTSAGCYRVADRLTKVTINTGYTVLLLAVSHVYQKATIDLHIVLWMDPLFCTMESSL